MAGAPDALGWFTEIPFVSRLYLTGAILTTTACFMDIVSPLTLYYNHDLILKKGQYWRLATSFLFFGTFSLDFLFHIYFVVRYCRSLEEGKFRGRTADFILMIIFGGALMLILVMSFDMFSKVKFLGHPLSFMMVYVWARSPENVNVRMSLLGIFQFNAPYLPWVLLIFTLFLGNPVETDIMGVIVGHIYYFLEDVYPSIAAIRGWNIKRVMVVPNIIHIMFGNIANAQIHVS